MWRLARSSGSSCGVVTATVLRHASLSAAGAVTMPHRLLHSPSALLATRPTKATDAPLKEVRKEAVLPRRSAWQDFLSEQTALLAAQGWKSADRKVEISRRWKELNPKPQAFSDAAQGDFKAAAAPLDWKVGHEAHGYRVTRRVEVAEFNLVAYELRHAESNALLYHLSRADPDCAFSVGFRTPVTSSNGVAHILEHTVLCGSERYPVRDPFFLLLRRSLKTYMNAGTGQDYTLYPFSTCNSKDFTNLLEVYLDAAFFPLLKEMDFRQEGHRLEREHHNAMHGAPEAKETNQGNEQEGVHSVGTNGGAAAASVVSPSDAALAPTQAPLKIKGVVYNEMKGALSDTGSLFMQRLQAQLFPTNCNHWDSGGDPATIPELTHEQLRAFHTKAYNVDNAVFISYGDREPPLELLAERILKPSMAKAKATRSPSSSSNTDTNASASDPTSSATATSTATVTAMKGTKPPPYTPEPRLSEPRTVKASCPPDPLVPDPAKQTKVSVAWVCLPFQGERTEDKEVEDLGLAILSNLLVEGPTAPMYQALIDPNIGSGYAPSTGYDNSLQEATFGLGLQGVAEQDVPRVVDIVHSTLAKVAAEGFPQERVDAVLHQIELSIKHVRSNFGIGLVHRMTPAWAHGWDPLSPLRFSATITALRAKLAQGTYFQDLIQRHLIENKHRVTFVMSPDQEYARKEEEAEAKKLEAQAKTMSQEELERIDAQAATLKQLQESKQDVQSCQLPSLSVSDIAPKAEVVLMGPAKAPRRGADRKSIEERERTNGKKEARTTLIPQPSNGVAYVRILVNCKRVPLDLRPYIPLYASFLTEMGADDLDSRQLAHELDMSTGGITADVQVFSELGDLSKHQEHVLIRTMALKHNIPNMYKLLNKVMYRPKFQGDRERLLQLLLQTAAGLAQSLQDSGSSYAVGDASSKLFSSAAISELYSGITHITFMNGLVNQITSAPPDVAGLLLDDVANKLQQVAYHLFFSGVDRTCLVGDGPTLKELEQGLATVYARPPTPERQLLKIGTTPRAMFEMTKYVFPFQPTTSPTKTFFALPLRVNNVALVVPTVPYTHPDAPKLDVMSKILSGVYVHREVREKGGAYGGGVSNSSDGILSFSSYRDPNTHRTIDAYTSAPDWLRKADSFTSTDVEEALLALFSSIDAPKSPASKGLGQWMIGITNEQRQEYRDRLLAVDRNAVLDVCDKYLSPAALKQAHVTIVGDEANATKELIADKKWRVMRLNLNQGQGTGAQNEEAEVDEEEEEAPAAKSASA